MIRWIPARTAAYTVAAALVLVSHGQAATAPVVASGGGGSRQTNGGQPRVNPNAALVAEFTKRVEAYMMVHEKVHEKGGVPSLPNEATPEQIDNYQRALARAIQQLRPKAKPGDIFTKEIRAYFRRQLERVFSGPEGPRLKAAIMDENPGPIKLQVNGRYPDSVPLATMPPQVLAEMPNLPQELEYRFIGERLILLDVPAHLIIDYIEEALPK
jgi:hypothetical protein